MSTDYGKVSPRDTLGYRDQISSVSEAVWPEFMFHDAVANEHWDGLVEQFGDYQFALRHLESHAVAAIINSVPLSWERPIEELPDDGWDWALRKSAADHAAGLAPNCLCGLQISIAPEFRGRGLSSFLLGEMRALASSKGLR